MIPCGRIRTKKWKLIANFEYAPCQETPPDYDNNAKGYVEIASALSIPYGDQYHLPFELYDLETDPWEQNNLAGLATHTSVRDQLIRRLRQWMKDTGDPLLNGPMDQGAYRQRMHHFKNI